MKRLRSETRVLSVQCSSVHWLHGKPQKRVVADALICSIWVRVLCRPACALFCSCVCLESWSCFVSESLSLAFELLRVPKLVRNCFVSLLPSSLFLCLSGLSLIIFGRCWDAGSFCRCCVFRMYLYWNVVTARQISCISISDLCADHASSPGSSAGCDG